MVQQTMIVCSVQLSFLIKKGLEMMLDGSEQAIIQFTEEGMELQSVDSISVCICSFKFAKERFFKYSISECLRVKFLIRPFYNFVKKFNAAAFSFDCDTDSLLIKVISNFDKSNSNLYHIVDSQDETVYFDLPRELFTNSPSFRLQPDEFANIILDLAVGGGYIEVGMNGLESYWLTIFETGTICITSLHQSEEYQVIQEAQEKISNRYLTKFFKQACTIAPICLSLIVHLRIEGPIILQFQIENEFSELIISIVPVCH
jgi:hypothetical protein